MSMAVEEHDIWVGLRTRHDLAADEVISALQKEIRRGHTENAAFLAYEMFTTSEELEAKLWQRLQVISIEDIGYGQTDAPILIHTLFQMHHNFPRPQGDRFLFALHAVRYLCHSTKDRSSDELLNWVKHAVETEGQRPIVPEYAIDMHTEAGRRLGRGKRHFLEEGALVSPELADREQTYRQRLLELLDEEDGRLS
jgi:replication-associated recombination protein RarA